VDYQGALLYLQQVQAENHKLSLANVSRLIETLPLTGKNKEKITFIQVGGTNGKGSTSSMLAAVLTKAGYRAGLFTSPHLVCVRERIIVDGKQIGRGDFARAVTMARSHAETAVAAGRAESMPTFFETTLLAALMHFQERQVQFAVLEVGLGGRLDATTALPVDLALVTNVSRDHQHILGRRISDIAAEKGAIARPGVPMLIGCRNSPRAGKVLAACAAQKGAPLYRAFPAGSRLRIEQNGSAYNCHYASGTKEFAFRLNLAGRHQAENAALVIKAVEILRNYGWSISDQALRRGLAELTMPARLETFPGPPPVIVDGAHNKASTEALASWLRERVNKPVSLVFGVLADKEYRAMSKILAPLARRVFLTEPPSPRRLPARLLKPWFTGLEVILEPDPGRALEQARSWPDMVVVCGSLYLAGLARELITRGGKNGRKQVQKG